MVAEQSLYCVLTGTANTGDFAAEPTVFCKFADKGEIK